MKGRELLRRRAGLEMSQAKLASELGVSRNTVARWEREEMKIPGRMLDLALRALELEKLASEKKGK